MVNILEQVMIARVQYLLLRQADWSLTKRYYFKKLTLFILQIICKDKKYDILM